MPTIKINLRVSTDTPRSESLGSQHMVHAGTITDVYKLLRDAIMLMPVPVKDDAPEPPKKA